MLPRRRSPLAILPLSVHYRLLEAVAHAQRQVPVVVFEDGAGLQVDGKSASVSCMLIEDGRIGIVEQITFRDVAKVLLAHPNEVIVSRQRLGFRSFSLDWLWRLKLVAEVGLASLGGSCLNNFVLQMIFLRFFCLSLLALLHLLLLLQRHLLAKVLHNLRSIRALGLLFLSRCRVLNLLLPCVRAAPLRLRKKVVIGYLKHFWLHIRIAVHVCAGNRPGRLQRLVGRMHKCVVWPQIRVSLVRDLEECGCLLVLLLLLARRWLSWQGEGIAKDLDVVVDVAEFVLISQRQLRRRFCSARDF